MVRIVMSNDIIEGVHQLSSVSKKAVGIHLQAKVKTS